MAETLISGNMKPQMRKVAWKSRWERRRGSHRAAEGGRGPSALQVVAVHYDRGTGTERASRWHGRAGWWKSPSSTASLHCRACHLLDETTQV